MTKYVTHYLVCRQQKSDDVHLLLNMTLLRLQNDSSLYRLKVHKKHKSPATWCYCGHWLSTTSHLINVWCTESKTQSEIIIISLNIFRVCQSNQVECTLLSCIQSVITSPHLTFRVTATIYWLQSVRRIYWFWPNALPHLYRPIKPLQYSFVFLWLPSLVCLTQASEMHTYAAKPVWATT